MRKLHKIKLCLLTDCGKPIPNQLSQPPWSPQAQAVATLQRQPPLPTPAPRGNPSELSETVQFKDMDIEGMPKSNEQLDRRTKSGCVNILDDTSALTKRPTYPRRVLLVFCSFSYFLFSTGQMQCQQQRSALRGIDFSRLSMPARFFTLLLF